MAAPAAQPLPQPHSSLPLFHRSQFLSFQPGLTSLSRSDLNSLVMNYLSASGFADAAQAFSRESGIPIDESSPALIDRMLVRSSLRSRRPSSALALISRLSPQLFSTDEKLAFEIEKQKFLDLFASGSAIEALKFAREILRPRAISNPDLIAELERVFSVLAFPNPLALPEPLRPLMEPKQYNALADRINLAILNELDGDKSHRSEISLKLSALIANQRVLKKFYEIPTIDIAEHSNTRIPKEPIKFYQTMEAQAAEKNSGTVAMED